MKKYKLETVRSISLGIPAWVRVLNMESEQVLIAYRTVQDAIDFIGRELCRKIGNQADEQTVLKHTEISMELAIRWEKEKSE